MIPVHEKTLQQAPLRRLGGEERLEGLGPDPPQQRRPEQHPSDQLAHVQGYPDARRELPADSCREEQDHDFDEEQEQLVVGHEALPELASTLSEGSSFMRSITACDRAHVSA